MIMITAPIGVFSLIAETINKVSGNNPSNIIELLSALGFYMVTVIIGLIIPCIIYLSGSSKVNDPMPIKTFFGNRTSATIGFLN